MATIRCTLVESPVMPRGFRNNQGDPISPAGYLSPEGSAADADPQYCDLLPWADPYIVSLVRGLQAATGASLADPWPAVSDAPGGSTRPQADPRAAGRPAQWPKRFGLNGS
jgi:hypothetical protein